MKVRLTHRAARDLDDLSPYLQNIVRKQFEFLAVNLRHPSIRAKKYSERDDVWQERVNRDYRFFFRIVGDTYHILMIVPCLSG